MLKISVSTFKAHCLKYIELAQAKHEEVIITRYSKPIAKLIPYDESIQNLFGRMRGTATIKGNLIDPIL
jgi:prevent-host-death family protein